MGIKFLTISLVVAVLSLKKPEKGLIKESCRDMEGGNEKAFSAIPHLIEQSCQASERHTQD